MNFNSQIATSREQSERLLALGLKKETADIRGVEGIEHTPTYAWSLHRLLAMLTTKKKVMLIRFEADLYDVLIDKIEHEIKEGYFNKEYLENGN